MRRTVARDRNATTVVATRATTAMTRLVIRATAAETDRDVIDVAVPHPTTTASPDVVPTTDPAEPAITVSLAIRPAICDLEAPWRAMSENSARRSKPVSQPVSAAMNADNTTTAAAPTQSTRVGRCQAATSTNAAAHAAVAPAI